MGLWEKPVRQELILEEQGLRQQENLLAKQHRLAQMLARLPLVLLQIYPVLLPLNL